MITRTFEKAPAGGSTTATRPKYCIACSLQARLDTAAAASFADAAPGCCVLAAAPSQLERYNQGGDPDENKAYLNKNSSLHFCLKTGV